MRRSQKKNLRFVLIATACLCVIACVVGGTYAYLSAKTELVSNEFVPAKVSCSVEEEFTNGVKSNVKVRNSGNVDAYIRATVVVTFVSEDGKVLAISPKENADYTVTWGADGWIKGTDGYWYYKNPVRPEETTAMLIESAQTTATAPTGYRLHIQSVASAVQSAPENAVQEAWGVSVNNGELLP